ncbi:MAG: hypothetical protein AB1411_14910 [Nitrospirota bacterium]
MKGAMVEVKQLCPGRCDRCGYMMVLVRLDDRVRESARDRFGWRCLVCEQVVSLDAPPVPVPGGVCGQERQPLHRGAILQHG